MSATANFKVDPRLASILGESYRSSEYALKELIDNAWDAEATEVRITVPTILSEDPIIIEDDGSGMKPAEVRDEYAQRIAAGVVHRYCASIGPRDSGLRAFRGLPIRDHSRHSLATLPFRVFRGPKSGFRVPGCRFRRLYSRRFA